MQLNVEAGQCQLPGRSALQPVSSTESARRSAVVLVGILLHRGQRAIAPAIINNKNLFINNIAVTNTMATPQFPAQHYTSSSFHPSPLSIHKRNETIPEETYFLNTHLKQDNSGTVKKI